MQLSLFALSFGALAAGLSAGLQLTAPRNAQSTAPASVASPGAEAFRPLPIACADSIRDQANPGSCLQATSVPTPGMLFPPPHDGGVDNVSGGKNSFIGGGSQNTTSGSHATIGGGQLNTADSLSTVGGGSFNHASSLGTIGGGQGNTAADLGTVGGGGLNTASGPWSTIAGGYFNLSLGQWSFVGGGYGNTASSDGSVSGGQYNSAGERASVGGGVANSAFGYESTISGGGFNYASGQHATVAGGRENRAGGNFSFAAGRRAKANHAGSFVWGDGQNVDKTSSAADQFNVYASGGARIFSNAAGSAGVLLAPGGGSWSSVSDRAAKENLAPVDAREVLERVCALPISTWNFRTQDASIRHMGPMAQDFRAAFGLGASDRTLDTIDTDGVALAAIQGLSSRMDEWIAAKEAEIAELREANTVLARRLASLESR